MDILLHCLPGLMFSHFGTELVYDRQTERWTHDDSIYHASIASHSKKMT